MSSILKAQEARRAAVDAGDTVALGGPGNTRGQPKEKLKSTAELVDEARMELQRQLKHRDPRVRREAVRFALDLGLGKWADDDTDEATEIVWHVAGMEGIDAVDGCCVACGQPLPVHDAEFSAPSVAGA